MSKCIDELNRLSRAAPQSIGFRPKEATSFKPPRLHLVASLAEENAEKLADYLTGADAGLLRISKPSSGTKALQKIAKTVPDIPWGGWLGGRGAIKQLTRVECDFIVFPATSTSLEMPEKEEVGMILEVEASLSEGLLRAANELPIDAVLVAAEKSRSYSVTWQHLMLFRRFADLVTKPLLASIPTKVTAGVLQSLWEAGVNGVVVEVTAEQPQGELKKLRRIIDKLESPSPRRRERTSALLPHISQEPSTVTAEEEEEEEEEEE